MTMTMMTRNYRTRRHQAFRILALSWPRRLNVAHGPRVLIKRVQQSIKSSKREGLDASLAVLKGLGVLEERTKSQVEVKNGFESWSDEQLREFIAGRSDGPGASEEGTGTAPTDKAVH
jgi:hypothetical protein